MTKYSKRIIAMILALTTLLLMSITVFAASEVRCIGGGAEDVPGTHKFGIIFKIYSHPYTYSWHDVSNQSSKAIYEEDGHDEITNCGQSDFWYNCPPGTIVQSVDNDLVTE